MLGRVINLTESLSAPLRLLIAAGSVLLAALAFLTPVAVIAQVAATSVPQNLQDTGLYADFKTLAVDPNHLAFTPQYPLWSDGAAKRRWLSLPAGGMIDGSDPDAWFFPIGTRFWKEFAFGGQRVETRYLERQADGQWLYAAYAWSPDGREAVLVSQKGRRSAYQLAAGRSHMIPGVNDCKACHEGGRSEILGFSTLQLSRDRDPDALHAEPRSLPDVDVNYLIEKGLLVGLPQALVKTPPRIEAASAAERAALGYMHGNCGHCHNDQGSLKNLGLFLRHVSADRTQPAATTTIGHPIRKPAPGQSPDAVLRVEPRNPETSALLQRMASRYPALQMPPLGSELVDQDAVALLYRWISELDISRSESNMSGKENRP
jgi:hypothetical protein